MASFVSYSCTQQKTTHIRTPNRNQFKQWANFFMQHYMRICLNVCLYSRNKKFIKKQIPTQHMGAFPAYRSSHTNKNVTQFSNDKVPLKENIHALTFINYYRSHFLLGLLSLCLFALLTPNNYFISRGKIIV